MPRQRTSGLDFEALHRLHMQNYERLITKAYDRAIYEAVAIAITLPKGKPSEELFSFDKHPASKKRVEAMMSGLQSRMQGIIEQGMRAEWTLANNKTDALVKRVFGKKLNDEAKHRLLSNNEDAREAFIQRKEKGLGLSDRVWKYTEQFKSEIEMGLDIGIRGGKSADELSRSLRGFLREPNKLFHRVRDEHGQLKLSARAKAYHPGQGVYRSSYKNALRLAVTETNIAYRTADHERQKALDFVVGIEVHLSGNHTLNGKPFKCMCDDLVGKYPKDFKFTGWHPHCRCYTTPILKTPEEMSRDTQKLLRGEPVDGHSVNEVKDLPQGFKAWMRENKSRIEGAKTLPYFIKDNPQWTSLPAKPSAPTAEERRAKILERAKARHEARTEDQVKAIRERWEIRRNVMDNSEKLEGLVDRYKSDAPTLASLSAKTLEEIKSGALKGDEMKERLNLISRKEKIKEAWDAGREVRNMAAIFDNPKDYINAYGIDAVREAYAEASEQIKKWDEIPDLLKRANVMSNDLNSMTYNTANKAWEIVSDAYERHLDYIFDKLDIEEALSGASYAIEYAKTTADKTIKKLSNDLGQIIDKPWSTPAIVEQKIYALTDAVDRAIHVDLAVDPNNGRFTRLSDEEAMSMISQFSKVGKKTADNNLRPATEKRWQELTDKQRRVVTKYTETFRYLNQRLRGFRYSGDRPLSEYHEDLPILTDILANTRTTSPMVVRRGVKNYLDMSLGKYISELIPGDEIIDYGFLSTATTPLDGFKDEYTFVIAIPAGAQGIYAEPFSHYTDSGKFSYKGEVWNGSSVEELRHEMEWIGQRGSRMRVINVVGTTIYLNLLSQGAHL